MTDGLWDYYRNGATRMGAFAAASTYPGSQPSYGTAYDMSGPQWGSAEQYQGFINNIAEAMQVQTLADVQTETVKKAHELALEKARNFEEHGQNSEDNASWWERNVSNPMSDTFKGVTAGIGAIASGDVFDPDHYTRDLYDAYQEDGGLLTKEEFNSFSETTQHRLLGEAAGEKTLADAAGSTVGKPIFTGLEMAYRGTITPFEMIHQAMNKPSPYGLAPLASFNLIDPMWFRKDAWGQAWNESQNESLGSAILKGQLAPYVSEDRLDHWQRNNSLFQATAAGSEFMVGWYADPAVFAARGMGNAARLHRNEMPLRETGSTFRAVTQNLQGEAVSTRNPVIRRYADWRAERIRDGQAGVEAYAMAVPEGQFATLPMFSRRGGAGAPIGHALHYAINSGDDALKDLAWGALYGDPKAYARLNQLKRMTPEELQKHAPGAQTFIDAIEATKTRVSQLEDEVAALEAKRPTPQAVGGRPPVSSPFFEWATDADIALKSKWLNEAKDSLSKYEDYGTFLELVTAPRRAVAQVNSKKRWSDAAFFPDAGSSHLFQSSRYGAAQTFRRVNRSVWIKKTNTVEFHHPNSGETAITRMFNQYEHMAGYVNPEAREAALQAYTRAATPMEKYKVLYDLDETHTIDALAQRLGVDAGVVRTVLDHTNTKRNEGRKVLMGNGTMYDTAPTLAQRVADSGDTSVRLVSRNEDDKTLVVELMDNKGHVITTEIPEEALAQRVTPVDPTQTPNYYTPIDFRHTLLTLKREQEMLEHMDASLRQEGQAGLMKMIDQGGHKFNALWKPLQLWRLGWPQRVLMDEGMRAMAVVGPMYWLTGNGAKAVGGIPTKAAAHMFQRSLDKRGQHVFRHRDGADLGPGGITRELKRDMDSFTHERTLASSVKVPASFAFRVNNARLDKVLNHISNWRTYRTQESKDLAWMRAFDEETDLVVRSLKNDPLRPPGRTTRDDATITTDFIQKMVDKGGYTPDQALKILRVRLPSAAFPYNHPMSGIANHLGGYHADAPSRPVIVLDPTNVSKPGSKSGFVVPISTDDFSFKFDKNSSDAAAQSLAMYQWYERNAQTLGSEGVRLVVDRTTGEITIGRLFNTRQRRQAEEFAKHVSQTVPDAKMWDLSLNKAHYVRDANEMSPIMEQLHRGFTLEQGKARDEGVVPADVQHGEDALHGSDSDVPEDLLSRELAPISRGRMIGEGLYTAVGGPIVRGGTDRIGGPQRMNENRIEGYGFPNIYTIKGTKSGKTFKTFDLDRDVADADFEAFIQFAKDNPDILGGVDDLLVEQWIRESRTTGYRYHTRASRSGQTTWGNLFESLANKWSDAGFRYPLNYNPLQRALTHYLEKQHNAGALVHKGGGQTGANYHVYVWLHPEDIVIKPLYIGDGKFMPVERWFSHPLSKETTHFNDVGNRGDARFENPVPESRTIRSGERNPMYAELRQIERQVESLGKDLTSKGRGKAANPEYRKLVMREQELMGALGLVYRNQSGKTTHSPLVPERYAVADEGRFNQMVDEAKAEDTQRTNDAVANSELRFNESLVTGEGRQNDMFDQMDMSQFDSHIDSPSEWLKRKLLERVEQGKKWTKIEPVDMGGTPYYIPGAFEGHDGEIFKGLVSSDKTIDYISEGHGSALSMFRHQAQGYKPINPPVLGEQALKQGSKENRAAMRYFQMWADTVNDQIGNSPIWSKMLNGWDDDRIVRWLEETPEGAAARREIMRYGQLPELWVNEHRARLNYYVPNKRLQRLLGKGRLKPSDLRREIHEDNYPTIYGPDLYELDKRRSFGNRVADMMWRSLGTVPIDALSRHPFAKEMYDSHMRMLIGSTDKKWLNQETIDRFVKESRDYSMRQVKKTLWDLTDETNFTDALRFIAPFWGAQQEAILKWLNIIADRPETVARFFVGQKAVYNNFVVIDEEGKPVDSARREGGLHNLGIYHPEDRVVFQLLPGMDKIPGMKEMGSFGVPLSSANTVLQGEMPLMPGLGPLMTAPAHEFLRRVSDTYGVEHDENFLYRWLFPVGRPKHGGIRGVLEQLSPGYGRRLLSATSGEDDPAKANLMWSTYREMYFQKREKLGRDLTEAETNALFEDAKKQANWTWGLRTVAGLVAPVQLEFRPKNQYFVDEAHRYQREFGKDWWDKFVADKGAEMAIFAQSSSNSTVGIPPSSEGMEEWAANKKLIRRFPEWGDAIISPEAFADDFSSDAYNAQFDITTGAGSTQNLRELRSPEERLRQMNERLGWREFRQFATMIDAELYARGLTNIQQTQAEDLRILKDAFVANLTQRNGDWREAYNQNDKNIYDRIEELRQFAGDKMFDKRPDMQGVRQYLHYRDQVTTILDTLYAQGGSRSLQAQDNGPLREWFYGQVGALVEANPSFGDFYHRYLEQDTLTMGGGGY